MVVQQFNNLFDFFNYIEFCPLCKKRTEPTITFAGFLSGSLDNNNLNLLPASLFNEFSINLFNNKITENYNYNNCKNSSKLIIGRQCRKYHFFYSGTCNLLKNLLYIDSIMLEKIHFIRMMPDSVHMAVNNDFTNSLSTVHITVNYFTKLITLPVIDFDFSSKKTIDKKLKIIQLLG